MTLSQPNDQDSEIILVAMQLFEKVWKPGRAVRLIGIGVSGLRPPIHQLSFWGEQNQNNI
jgi:nucleotidyltransferase/DNA polymerase involved in DNA repair